MKQSGYIERVRKCELCVSKRGEVNERPPSPFPSGDNRPRGREHGSYNYYPVPKITILSD
ncbi:hypothetical protein J6590_013650 [Homalodisca vitripennis]|nr:hypothetical protein J6590_013650 [Homalodisca vitripennis]